MFYQLTESLTDIVIEGLRSYWSLHPKYRDSLAPNIQGKFSFQERPQMGIIVKPSGSNHLPLTWDNFGGLVLSQVRLTKVPSKPGLALGWVMEDPHYQGKGIPTTPGIYFIDIVLGSSANLNTEYAFYVDPFLEAPLESHKPIQRRIFLTKDPIPNTLLVYEKPNNILLKEGTDFEVVRDSNGQPTSEILFSEDIPYSHFYQVSYKYGSDVLGPFEVQPNFSDSKSIPGIILAFGNFLEEGDRMAVVVEPSRVEVAKEYGGRWDTSFEIDIMARDVRDQRQITDRTAMYVYSILRSHLSSRGIELKEMSIGGESEEIYDENGDDYFYNATINFTLESDWFVWVPLDITIRGFEYDLNYSPFGLQSIRDPYYSSKFKNEGLL